MKTFRFIITLIIILCAGPALAAPTASTGPWGVDYEAVKSAFGNFSSAVNSSALAGNNLVIAKPVTCNNDLTIPATVSIEIKSGGSINVSAGKTLTINGGFRSDNGKSLPGAGRVVFNPLMVADVNALWFGASPSETAANNTTVLNKLLSSYPSVYLPSGTYAVNALTMSKNGARFHGDPGYETGSSYPMAGTILSSGGVTCLTVNGGTPTDRVTIDGIAFIGTGTGIGMYVKNVRQSTFSRLMFYNFDKCMHFETLNWLNKLNDIKAFNFNTGIYLNSGSEDSVYENIIARGYNPTSIGLFLNYYAQLNYFVNCDFSDNFYNVKIWASLGDPVLTFESCTFEQGTAYADNSRGIYASVSVPMTINMIGSRLYYKMNDAHKPSAVAFEAGGTGGINLNIIGTKITEYPLIFKSSSTGFTRIFGEIRAVTAAGYTLFSGVSGATNITVSNNPVKNLLSKTGTYDFTWDTATPLTFDLSQLGTGGRAKIYISLSGAPDKYGEITIMEKGYYSNGLALEQSDAGNVYTESVSGNILTITAASSFTAVVKIVK